MRLCLTIQFQKFRAGKPVTPLCTKCQDFLESILSKAKKNFLLRTTMTFCKWKSSLPKTLVRKATLQGQIPLQHRSKLVAKLLKPKNLVRQMRSQTSTK